MRRTTMRWLAITLLSLASLVGGLIGTLDAAAATIVYVAPSGSGGGSCATPDFTSIQSAVDAATAGDTIMVCAGTYNENVTIGTSLTLAGAQAGVSVADRTSGASDEAIVNGTGGSTIQINASNVTIDGFTLTNSEGLSSVYDNEQSNVTVTNNFIGNETNSGTSPVIGIYVEGVSSSLNNIVIDGNDISDIHQTGGYASAMGILIGDSNGAGTTIDGLVIHGNTISNITARTDAWRVGHGAYGILLNHGTSPSAGSTPNAQITNNTITNLEGLWAHGIGLEGNTPNAVVEGNTISQLIDHKSPTDAAAVNIEDNASARTIALHFNNFSSVNIGVQNKTDDPVDAKFNWWGCSSGPGFPGCATTVGRVVSQPVLRNPYVDYTNGDTSDASQFINNLLNGGFGFFSPWPTR